MDESVLTAGLIATAVDAAARRVVHPPRPPMTLPSPYDLGRLDGLVEALAHLIGRPVDELREEALARGRETAGIPS